MTDTLATLRRIAGLSLLLAAPASALQAQAEPAQPPQMESFFEALAADFETRDVFAVDAKSLALTLGLSLRWPVSESGVTEALGSEYRFGELGLFLSCEGDVPCVMTSAGSHVEVTRATTDEPGHVQLRLMVSSTQDASVAREFNTVNLVHSDDGWRIVEGNQPPR